MSLSVMPDSDYKAICDQTRRLTGKSGVLTSDKVVADLTAVQPRKPEQEKTIAVTSNGQKIVTPDVGKVLSKVIVNADVAPSSIIKHIQRGNVEGNGNLTATLSGFTDLNNMLFFITGSSYFHSKQDSFLAAGIREVSRTSIKVGLNFRSENPAWSYCVIELQPRIIKRIQRGTARDGGSLMLSFTASLSGFTNLNKMAYILPPTGSSVSFSTNNIAFIALGGEGSFYQVIEFY